MIQLLGGLDNVQIRHNTLQHNAVGGQFVIFDIANDPLSKNLVIDDNVATWGGPWGAVMGHGNGTSALVGNASPWAFDRNVVIGLLSNLVVTYPINNSYPLLATVVGFVNPIGGDYTLSAASPYKGKSTTGNDPGINGPLLNSLTAGAVVP
jgi:hypothetical protein